MLKYICTKDPDRMLEIFSFPMSVNHDTFAEAIRGIKNQMTGNWERIYRTPVSAGFISSKGVCFGKSITLELKSKEEDTTLLKAQSAH